MAAKPRLTIQASSRTLHETARHVVYPSGIVSTAWPRIEKRLSSMAISFDGWQKGASQLALAKRRDGKYASTIGGVTWSIPRQVGKTFSVGVLIVALCIEYPGLRVIWTAHRTRTSTNTFRSMQSLVKRKKVSPHVKAIRTANGEQEIAFHNGALILFGAREQGFGRGFDEIDILVFDEAQILTEKALEDMVASTNQARHEAGALIFFIGTPPRPVDPGEAFSMKRSKALSGKSDDLVYVEFSADEDADPDDREQWAKANPSFPHRTPLESMLRLRENLPSDEAWKREALGIWDPVATGGVIPPPSWATQADGTSLAVDRFALGVECGPDLSWASVAFAGQRPDGHWHFELDEDQHTRGRGVAWLVPHIKHLLAENSSIRSVVVDVAGPIKALLEQRNSRWYFTGTDIEVTPVKVAELGAGCALVLNGIVTGTLFHVDQPQFSTATLSAGKRALGDTGMWVWSRKLAESDITPIQAGTLALIGAQKTEVQTPVVRSGGRRVVTFG